MSMEHGVPASWAICKLDDVLLKMSNGANVTQHEEMVGYPICRIETIWNEGIDLGRVKYIKENDPAFVEKYALQYGDILLSHINSDTHLGKTGLFKNQIETLIHGINILLLRPVKDISPDFINYQLKHLRTKGAFIDAAQRAVNQSSINQKKLKSFRVFIAPLPEQHRIVAKIEELFSELDKGVEYLMTAQAQLKVYRQALLKHAFEGKLTVQWRVQRRAQQSVAPAKAGGQPLNDMDSRPTPSRGLALRGNDEVGSRDDEPLETAADLLKRIQQERAQRYQQQLADWEVSGKQGSKPKSPKSLPPLTTEELAELPELPEGWEWVKLGQVFNVYVGSTPSRKRADFWNGDISWVSSGEVAFCRIKGTKEKITNIGYENASTEIHPIGTIMLAMIGEGKTRGQAAILDIAAAHNQNTAAIRVSESKCSSSFVYYYLVYQYEITRKIGSGNNQKALNKERVSDLIFPLCSIAEMDEVVRCIDEKLSIADQLDQTITTALQQAEALRQSILKKAFSGQLVPQDPNDEPASELLARIKAERLASQGNVVVRRKGGQS